MLGDNFKVASSDFNPFLPDHKEGYCDLEQLRPGIIMCPFCDTIIDAKDSRHLKATYEAINAIDTRSWASVPVCRCPGVWAVYEPGSKKWSFRYKK